MKNKKLDKFHYHEIMDRSFMVCSIIEDHLINHPVTDKKIRKRLEKAIHSICTAVSIMAEKEANNLKLLS